MTVDYRSSANGSATGGGAITVNKPTGTVDGDFMLAFALSDSTGAITWSWPSGWTEIRNTTANVNIASAYKFASGEGASYSFDPSGSALSMASILSFTGVHVADPVNVSAGASVASSTSANAPTVTTTVDDCQIVCGFAASHATSYSTSVLSERVDFATGTTTSGTCLMVGDIWQPELGASGTKLATSANSTTHGTMTVALRPASPTKPPYFVDSSTAQGYNAASVSVSKPTNAATGDYMIVRLLAEGDSARPAQPSTPTGWTLESSQTFGTKGRDLLYSRIVQAGDTSWSWASLASATTYSFGVLAFRRHDPAAPMETPVFATSSANAATMTAPDLTTLGADRLIVRLYGQGATGGTGRTWTGPALYTERYDVSETTFGFAAQAGYTIDTPQAPQGATGTADGTISETTANPKTAWTLAIRPAPSDPVFALVPLQPYAYY